MVILLLALYKSRLYTFFMVDWCFCVQISAEKPENKVFREDLYTRPRPIGRFGVQARLVHEERKNGSMSRRERHLQQDRQMVGDAAGVAGAGVGAEGFLAGMDGVARE